MKGFLDQFLDCGTVFVKDRNHFFIGYGKRAWSAEPSSSSPCWYFPDFFLKSKTPWFTHEFWEIIDKNNFRKIIPDIPLQASLNWKSNQIKIFENSFKNLQNEFLNQKLHKAVPYFFQTASMKTCSESICRMLSASLHAIENNTLQLYGFWGDGEGILGATPEILFNVEGRHLRTMACAGTLFSEANSKEEAKLLKEHSYVVEGIVKAISHFGANILVGNSKWQHFIQLKHLLTPIEMIFDKPIAFSELVQALHPTAAIGTFPKDAGKIWLSTLEKLIPRKRFGAPCACVFQEKALCLVAIRNVQWNGSEMQIAAGSGIIAESDLEKEKQEIEMKIASIKNILNL